MRFRPHVAAVAVALAAGLALAGCVPSDGTPGSSGVPVLGPPSVTAAQLVDFYRSHDPATLPYRAQGATLDQLAQLFVDEGNRYGVRGDIAFAQSIVETGWFNFPDSGIVKPSDNNFAGLGACSSCGSGRTFSSAQSGVRAQIQLLRNYADITSRTWNIPDAPVPELWGLDPNTAAYNFNHFSGKGRAPLWNDLGNGNWASAPDYAPIVLGVYNQVLSASGVAAQCPPDGLLFGPFADFTFCPPALRQPGRAIASTGTGGYYVLNGDGSVRAYNGAPWLGSPAYGGDFARDIAVMPDGNGYVVLAGDGSVSKFGSAADPGTIGALGAPVTPGTDDARAIAITPDEQGYVILFANGAVSQWGTAASGPLAGLGNPTLDGEARSIAITPDGAGYLVLDRNGGVTKWGTATQGFLTDASTPYFGIDVARDIVVVGGWGVAFGYYVVDGWGGIWGSQLLPARRNPRAQLFADRWRGVTIIGGVPVVVRNDGTTATSVAA